ncbi:MAG: hypothetical protein WC292_01210 [Clostridia bacterium]
MGAFFTSLSVLEIILFILAAASSIILVIQIILMLIGFGGGDADLDGGDMDFDDIAGADGLTLFTIKGIIAFFSIGGWVGLAVSRSGAHIAWVFVSAFLTGGAALVGVAFLFKLMGKLQQDGSIKRTNAIGHTATVYLTIPPRGKGTGKINVLIQERYIEAEAVTLGDQPIPTGSIVNVIAMENDVLVVEIKN